MTWLAKAIVTLVLLSLVAGKKDNNNFWDSSEENNNNDLHELICNNPFSSYLPFCQSNTAASTASTTRSTTEASTSPSTSSTFELETTTPSTTESSSDPSSLERAHWCRLLNGTFLPLGHTFMYSACALCQCIQTHSVICTTLRCMNTYCIDESVPTVGQGQCCAQCGYENQPTPCIYNGITFPHGTIIKASTNNLRCWCQSGTVECRRPGASVFSGFDLLGSGSAVFIILAITFGLLSVGTILCCATTLWYYYYYQRHPNLIQQVYEQYWGSAGWQPMGDDTYVEEVIDEKQAEAEQSQYDYDYPTGSSEAYTPPPYALYSGSYVANENTKDQKST